MCGIFAIINHHKRQLDKRAFITLGCANDSRGGDACGIMIDRQVERGTEKEDQLFQFWYPKSALLKATQKCYVAFGHCRKASVGGVAADKAQPVTIYDKDGRMLFAMIHNGTIYNYEDLAKKYIPNFNIKGMTDSQVMARIFFEKGYDVLAEYNGGGAFIIQDYRSNSTLIFRGESLGSVGATKVEAERPLYLVQTGKSVVFSSLFPVLQGLYWGFTIYDVPSNALLRCDGKEIYIVKEYDRSKCYSCRRYTSAVTTPSSKTTYGGASHHKGSESYGYGYGCGYDMGDCYDDEYSPSRGCFTTTKGPDKVEFDYKAGLYSNARTGEVLHKVYDISHYGIIMGYPTIVTNKYYFWRGIMLSGENAYNRVRLEHANGMDDRDLLNLARRLAAHPVMIQKRYYTYSSDNEQEVFNEDYVFPATKTKVTFKESGKVKTVSEVGAVNSDAPAELPEAVITKIVDYVEESIQRND